MRVWQPGSHLTVERGGEVRDWSWRQSRRRIRTLTRLARPYKLRAGLAIAALLAATATALAGPYLSKLAIDDGITKGNLTALGWIVAAFLFVGLANWGASSAQTYFTGWTGERVLADLRGKLFRHLQGLSLGYYERNRAGVIISRLTNDVDALDQLVTDGVTSLVQNTLLLAGSIVILFLLDWRLALATLIILPALVIGDVCFPVALDAGVPRRARAPRLVTATLAEDISGMRVVQVVQPRGGRTGPVPRGERALPRREPRRRCVLNGLYFPFVDFLSSVATAIVLGFGGYLVSDGNLTIGTLFAFIGYLANFFDPVQILSQFYNTFLSATAALDKIMDVMDETPEIVDRPDARPLAHIEGHVRFDHMRFGYGDGPDVLHDLDLDVPTGHDRRPRRPHGRRQVDDRQAPRPLLRPARRPDHDRRRRPARRHAGVAPPPARHRAAGGLPVRGHAPREHRVRAAGRAGRGRDRRRAGGRRRTVRPAARGRLRDAVGERGARLSLGQRQLVAFARALLADPRILILDEATSCVDIGTERQIELALRRLLVGRTAFIIAHRLSTIRRADLHRRPRARQRDRAGDARGAPRAAGRYPSLYGDWAAVA